MNQDITAEDAQFLAEVAAESIGWLPLGDGAYLHVGDPDALVIGVVGVGEVGVRFSWRAAFVIMYKTS